MVEVPGPDSVVGTAPPRARAWALAGGALTAALVLAAGLVGGWVAARQSAAGGESHEGGHEEGGEGHGHEEGRAPSLSARTLANLGVEFRELAVEDYVEAREIAGALERRPGARRPVYAPIAGRVREVSIEGGDVVASGDVVATIVRDAFPRPALALTDSVLRPLNEDYHHSLAELRTAAQSLSIAREELARVRAVLAASTSSAGLPSKAELDLSYDERRAIRALENAREEGRRNGLSEPQIAALERGETSGIPDQPPVRAVLERNGLWSEHATRLLGLLPAAARSTPFALAVLGELAGSRLLTTELVDAVASRPALAEGFLDVAGLVQQGATVASLVELADAGALAAVVSVRAPKDAPDWDVVDVDVRPGAHVDAGTVLADVEDGRRLVLRLAPTGPDVPAVESALREGARVSARPLVEGAGLAREGLSIRRVESEGGDAPRASALVDVENEPIEAKAAPSRRTRTWALRPGTRYVARVPLRTLSKRFVLPADAVVPRGADSVVVLRAGPAYRLVPVRVEHADSRVAVVADDGALFAGDTVAVKNAFALSLALQAGSGGEGGGHHHHH